jgi:hypothetical protein
MSTRERLEREAADMEHAAGSYWRRNTPVAQEHAAQLAGDLRTILAEHAALLDAVERYNDAGMNCDAIAEAQEIGEAAVALCREAPHA